MTDQALRIGVFVCDCGLNIAGTVDTEEVARFAAELPDVVAVVRNRYTCADPGQNEIKKAIAEHDLNRVVVASCTPKIHEPTFRHCVADTGLNPYLVEMANIREHCSWVHMHDREAATEKAKDLVRSAVGSISGPGAAGREGLPSDRLGIGDRWWSGGYPDGAGAGRWRPSGLSGREGAFHRRDHGRAGQDVPDHGLLDMNPRP